MRTAVTIQEGLVAAETEMNDGLKMRFGLHLADVMVYGDDLLGDGINVAARIPTITTGSHNALSAITIWLLRSSSGVIKKAATHANAI